ncbi:MAG: Transcriptional regulator, LacI family [uncultured Paraburkholderia sp.]|nr:MAG: Transcriptional regulator, LacI family [uncultured Paraburkholderia sp.]CAH2924397.1 MAG: Transcriptional regulator, LacI family [uncultured Paraburkholderia sp.]
MLEAVDALGYCPHLAARALAEGRAPTLALMVSSIANPFYPEFVLVTNANLDFADLHTTESRGTPVVLCMWERPNEPPGLPCVAVDFRLAGEMAGAHLLELGHRRIGAIVSSKSSGIHAARYQGFVDALRAARVPKGRVKHAPDTIQGGYDATRALLEADPKITGIYATNDLPALGAMHAAADLGLSEPGDLSVIGITDIQLARESRPALTTVAVPIVEVAELAVSLLRELIEPSYGQAARAGTAGDDKASAPMRISSPPQLVVRASTGAPRER